MWIRTDVDLTGHPKTKRFARLLRDAGQDPGKKPWAYLDDLWRFVRKFSIDGDLADYSEQEIAEAAGWEQDAGAFVKALEVAGFIDQAKTGRVVHEWWEHNGQHLREAAKKRRQRAEKRGTPQGQPEDVPGMSRGCPALSPATGQDGTGRTGDDNTDTDPAQKCAAPPDKPAEATLFESGETERPRRGRKPKKREDVRAWRIVKAWISAWRFWGKGAEPTEAKREGKTYDSIAPLLESNTEQEILANLERYIRIKFREGKASYAHINDFVKTFGDWSVYPILSTRCRVYCEGQWCKPDGQGSYKFPILWADGATVDYEDETGENTIMARSRFEREFQAKRAGA